MRAENQRQIGLVAKFAVAWRLGKENRIWDALSIQHLQALGLDEVALRRS